MGSARKRVAALKVQKRSEKIAHRKKLLTDLKKCQLKPEQLELIHSTTSMQTNGLKRFLGLNLPTLRQVDPGENFSKLVKGRWRRRQREALAPRSSSSSSEDTDEMSTDMEEPESKKEEPKLESPPQRPEPAVYVQVAREPAVNVQVAREPAVYVQVARDPDIERSRLALPIIGEEQAIIENIRYNDVVIVSGETGSGKTTQIPQFLYEAGYALNGKVIGITEPRRVAAVSMSERVARELNLTQDEVSYQIRFSGNVSSKTQIKFMTDGVLLRECQQDFLLSKYSVIIIDEAHERSVFSDILIGLLSRIVPMRAKRGDPLKLVIMSATLRVGDFTENSFLFKTTPPIINIDARQYSVDVHFAKRTPSDYLQAAYKKVCSIHSKMPKGGILVFVTSQMDVTVLCRRLRDKFSKDEPLHCLGLYAMLSLEKQRLVFKDPPQGTRLCVVATNVAETSITIPNIKYVVDTGMEKTKVYDLASGVSRFVTYWTSKSSAEQRKGRAGRMGPGHCYRLYSSAVFANDFSDFAEPRILQKPFEDILLQMKSMNIDNVVNFPFPTRPSTEALMSAEKKLILLGALDDSQFKTARFADIAKTEFSSRPTPLGRAMANFAVSARCSKMIVTTPADLLPHVICLVSALSTREMFLEGNKWREIRKKWAGHGNSKLLGDFMLMIRAVCAADSFQCSNKLCLEHGLRTKALLEIHRLRTQLTQDVNKHLKCTLKPEDLSLKKPTEAQSRSLRKLLLSSYCDHVARKLPNGSYECMETEDPVYIGSESALKSKRPEYLIYKELYHGDKKMYMRDVAAVESNWLSQYENLKGWYR